MRRSGQRERSCGTGRWDPRGTGESCRERRGVICCLIVTYIRVTDTTITQEGKVAIVLAPGDMMGSDGLKLRADTSSVTQEGGKVARDLTLGDM